MGVMAYRVPSSSSDSRECAASSRHFAHVVLISSRFKHYHNIHDVLQQMQFNGRSKQEQAMVMRAYEFAKEKHMGQTRADEETPFIYHLLEVAHKVASWGYGSVAVSTALLHDAPEDANVRLFEIEMDFGSEVAYLTGLLAKPKLYQGSWINATSSIYCEVRGERGRELYNDKSNAYYNRLFKAGSLTALAIKFADSSQNLEEILNLPQWKRTRNVGTMVKHLVKLGEKLMPPIAFVEFVGRLRGLGLKIQNGDNARVLDPVTILPARSYIGQSSLEAFRPPGLDHLTLYWQNNNAAFELGLPREVALVRTTSLFSALRAAFNERRFKVLPGESLLPPQMVGHEEIFSVTSVHPNRVSVDEIRDRSIEFLFRNLRPLLEAAIS